MLGSEKGEPAILVADLLLRLDPFAYVLTMSASRLHHG